MRTPQQMTRLEFLQAVTRSWQLRVVVLLLGGAVIAYGVISLWKAQGNRILIL
jgi:hypothetical protein